MSFVLIVLLALLCALCMNVGQTSNGTPGVIATVIFFPACIVLYISPSLVAKSKGHAQIKAIAVLNLLLGWTFLGWVGALVWAYSRSSTSSMEDTVAQQAAIVDDYIPIPNRREAVSCPTEPTIRYCPYCAEEIRQEAIKCKHCGSDVSFKNDWPGS